MTYRLQIIPGKVRSFTSPGRGTDPQVLIIAPWRYAVRAQLVRPDLADEDVKTLTKRLTPTLGLYVVMILVGLFLPILAVFGYLAIAIFILIPFSALRHRSSRP